MSNPLLEGLKLPGRIFQLPSKGLFYTNGELSPEIKDGIVHVRPMSALDEINMKNADQLFSGSAVETVFRKCVQGIEKPDQLLAKDVDALMIYLRVVTYGPSYEFAARHNCHIPAHLMLDKDVEPSDEIKEELKQYFSEFRREHSYAADVEQIMAKIKYLDPTTLEDAYTVNLPEYNQVVKLRPNQYQQVLAIVRKNQNKTDISVAEQQENLILLLLGVIESINGVTDEAFIKEWAEQIQPSAVNRIGDKIENVDEWGAEMRWTCKCKDCGETFTVDIPINPVSFFTE